MHNNGENYVKNSKTMFKYYQIHFSLRWKAIDLAGNEVININIAVNVAVMKNLVTVKGFQVAVV